MEARVSMSRASGHGSLGGEELRVGLAIGRQVPQEVRPVSLPELG
jgi:hypothetical protein